MATCPLGMGCRSTVCPRQWSLPKFQWLQPFLMALLLCRSPQPDLQPHELLHVCWCVQFEALCVPSCSFNRCSASSPTNPSCAAVSTMAIVELVVRPTNKQQLSKMPVVKFDPPKKMILPSNVHHGSAHPEHHPNFQFFLQLLNLKIECENPHSQNKTHYKHLSSSSARQS